MSVTTIIEDSDEAIVVTAEETFEPVATTKVVSFTRLMTLSDGDQIVNGVGFKPRAILFTTGLVGSGNYASVAVSAEGSVGGMFLNGAANGYTGSAGLAGSSNGNYQNFVVSSFDNDGFTITWSKTGSPTGTAQITALCFR